jgi:hypothetical protein
MSRKRREYTGDGQIAQTLGSGGCYFAVGEQGGDHGVTATRLDEAAGKTVGHAAAAGAGNGAIIMQNRHRIAALGRQGEAKQTAFFYRRRDRAAGRGQTGMGC